MKFKFKSAMGHLGLLSILAGSFILFQNFTSPNSSISPKGTPYLWDGFEEQSRSNSIWILKGRSCMNEPHWDANGNYPTFGTSARPGYCGFHREADTSGKKNTFLRFVTQPFDRRDALVSDLGNSVDHGKGGGETRRTGSFNFGKAGSNKKINEGWDTTGNFYQTSDNMVRYSFKFRLKDISIFETGLAKSTTISQFHAGATDYDKTFKDSTCGDYYSGTAPGPALRMELYKEDQVRFTLTTQIFQEEITRKLKGIIIPNSCITQNASNNPIAPARTICTARLWTKPFPKKQVMNKWLDISLKIRFAEKGHLEFYLGDSKANSSIKYQRRVLAHAIGGVEPIRTKYNKCASRIYLGNYVLGYSQSYGSYGYKELKLAAKPKNKEEWQTACDLAKKSRDKSVSSIAKRFHRICGGDEFVSPRLSSDNENRFDPFIYKTNLQTETPPQLTVDYDDFRIVQD